MKHFGDITKINGAEVPTVDIITGGSPCQDLSVAGKRAGLAGERSGLFMEQMRIVKEMRAHDRANGRTGWMVRPRYMVWENVPGAFSSGKPKGADFAAVIEEIIKVAEPGTYVSVCVPNGGWTKSGCYYAEDGSWSIAWRVHDAQFWGVPQRRKRIALVADFGGLSAPEILFERKGLSRDFEPCGEARQETAGAVGDGVEGAGGCLTGWDVQSKRIFNPDGKSGTLNSGTTEGMNIVPSVLQTREPILLESNQNHATVQTDGISTTLPASMGMGGGYVPMVTAYGISSYDSNAMKSPNPHSGIYAADTARTLDLNGGSPACNQGGIAVVQSVGCDVYNQEVTGEVAASLTAASGGTNTSGPKVLSCGFKPRQGVQARTLGFEQEMSHTINTDQNYAVLCLNDQGGQRQPCVVDTYQETAGALCAGISKQVGNQIVSQDQLIIKNAIVRRLTPLECERLQGYPDGWTDIGEWVDSKGKKHKDADSPRYKALGNSIALPFWQWMARRICAQYERPVTMASLFDGIGGFPLVFQRCGAVPVWASEIEEFPIAVTKIRFPEEEQL